MHGLAELDTTNTGIDNSDAAVCAERLLRGVDTRLAHSAGVAHQVGRVGYLLEGEWESAITEAAWLHDVGYNERLAVTGFHPLDGARWLRDCSWPIKTCRLVAWHTASEFEGRLRGLDEALAAEFEPPLPLVAAALAWADLTSSPTGTPWTVGRRLADILRRHPTESIGHCATVAALPALWGAAKEIESRLVLGGEDL